MLFVCHPKNLNKHCLQFLLGVKMAPRETENNAYSNFWGDKQRALWYVMEFLEWSIVEAAFELQSSRVFQKRSKFSKKLLHYDKVTVSCPTNMSPEHFFQALQRTKINLKKTVSLILFSKNHSCNPLQSSSSLSIHASFYFIFPVLYPLFMF